MRWPLIACFALLPGCGSSGTEVDPAVEAFCERLEACELFDEGDSLDECLAENDSVNDDCSTCIADTPCETIAGGACSDSCGI